MIIFELICSPRNSDKHILREWCGNKIGTSGGEEEQRRETCWANIAVDAPVVEPEAGSVSLFL